jgi:hypothetical protein
MKHETDRPTADSLRATYESPQALRLHEACKGMGGGIPCDQPGSGADDDCGAGSSPAWTCESDGNQAGFCIDGIGEEI